MFLLRYRRNEGKRPRGFRGQNTRRQQPVDAYLSLDILRFLCSLSFFLAFLYLCFSFLLFLLSPRSYPYFSDDDDNDDSFRRHPKPLVQFLPRDTDHRTPLIARSGFANLFSKAVATDRVSCTSFFLYLRTFSLFRFASVRLFDVVCRVSCNTFERRADADVDKRINSMCNVKVRHRPLLFLLANNRKLPFLESKLTQQLAQKRAFHLSFPLFTFSLPLYSNLNNLFFRPVLSVAISISISVCLPCLSSSLSCSPC